MPEPLPIFTGTVLNGRLTLDEPERFKTYVQSLSGRVVDVTVCKHREKRSNPQNALYWSCYVAPLASHHGWDADDMHEYLKLECNPVMLHVNGQEVKVGGSTAKMDRAEFTAYLERIERHPVSEGFIFPHEDRVEVGA